MISRQELQIDVIAMNGQGAALVPVGRTAYAPIRAVRCRAGATPPESGRASRRDATLAAGRRLREHPRVCTPQEFSR